MRVHFVKSLAIACSIGLIAPAMFVFAAVSLVDPAGSGTAVSRGAAPVIDTDPVSIVVGHAGAQVSEVTLEIRNSGDAALNWTLGSSPAIAGGTPALLYDNGPWVTSQGDGPGGADRSMIQNQTLGMSTSGINIATPNMRVADDFKVPARGHWQIDEVRLFAYHGDTGANSTFNVLNFRIWDGPPNDPASNVVFGDTATNRMIDTGWTNAYRVSESVPGDTQRPIMYIQGAAGVSLPEGRYWLDWQMDVTTPPFPRAALQPPVTILGETTTGNALHHTGSGWGPFRDFSTSAPQGAPFQLLGSGTCQLLDDVPWLSYVPASGSIGSGGSDIITLTIDSVQAPGEGVHEAHLCIASNDPENPLWVVPVTLDRVGAEFGRLQGTVTSAGYCGAEAHRVAGAQVTVTGASGVIANITSDSDGLYSLWVAEDEGPVDIAVTAAGYRDAAAAGVAIQANQTTVAPFDLVLDAPCATVDGDVLDFVLPLHSHSARTLSIGNLAGGAPLIWMTNEFTAVGGPGSDSRVPSPAGRAGGVVGEGAPMGLASTPGASWSGLPALNPAGGLIDCDKTPHLIIHDDGTVENGYSAGPAQADEVRIVDRFTPAVYPARFATVCVALLSAGPTSLDFELVFYADDGGGPGRELGSLPVNAADIPVGPPQPAPVWHSYDVSALGINRASGSVYIGVRYAPSAPNVFIAADQSTDRPVGYAGGYWWSAGAGVWIPTQNAFPNYRALMLRAAGVPIDCTLPAWLNLDTATGSIDAGHAGAVQVTANSAGMAPGDYQATLCLTTNDSNAPLFALPVTLTVVAQEPGVLEVMPPALDFGPVPVAGESIRSFTVSNTAAAGAAALELTHLTVTGDAGFSLAGGSCVPGTSVLDPGQSCTVDVTFQPFAQAVFTGEVTVWASHGQTGTVTLTGAGVLGDDIHRDRFETGE